MVGLTPWAGDRAMATLELLKHKEGENPIGTFHHILVNPGYKRMALGAQFSHSRVTNEVASQWMARTRVLHDYVKDSLGQVSKVPKHPIDTVPEPDEATLRQIPGAYEAYKGIRALEFKTCVVRGGRVLISPDKLAVFQQAPHTVSNTIKELEDQHLKHADLLSFMETQPNTPVPDPRANPDAEEGVEENPAEWMTLESEQAFLDKYKGDATTSHTAMGEKNVTLIRNETKGELWLLSKQDDITLPQWLCLGGFGSGVLKPNDPEATADVVPFSLQKDGDKTLAQVVHGNAEESKINTLYSHMKPLEKTAAKNGNHLTIIGYGKVLADGEAGNHRFIFETPDGHPKHQGHTYFLQNARGKQVSSGNFFSVLTNVQKWMGGLEVAWRFAYEPVTHQFMPKKPVVATKKQITLTKGMPLRILWQAVE